MKNAARSSENSVNSSCVVHATMNTERGSRWKRNADLWCGVPLVGLLGLYRRFSCKPSQTVQRIGILSVGAIGDILLASCLFEQLRARYPEARITLLCSKANAVAVSFIPCVDESHCFAVTDLSGLLRAVRNAHFDLLLDTGQWARFGAMVCGLSGAGRTVGFRTPGQFRHCAFDETVLHRRDCHELHNFLELGRAATATGGEVPAMLSQVDVIPVLLRPAPALPADMADFAAERWLICCHMYPSGTRSYLKEWPAAHWATFIERLSAAGLCVVLTGSPGNRACAANFLDQLPTHVQQNVFNAAGRYSLWEEAAMLQKAGALVSVNTGFGHLGGLLGVPTVDIHGPTSPLRWGVVGPQVRHVVPDSGGGYLHLGFEYPVHDDFVLDGVTPEKVFMALQDLRPELFALK